MDLSKLPRLSNTQQPAGQPPADSPAPSADPASLQPSASPDPVQFCLACGAPLRVGARFCDGCGAKVRGAPRPEVFVGAGIEAWISIGVGLFLLLLSPRMAQWVSHRLFGTHFSPFQLPDGTIVPYTQVPEFWSDLGPTLFALALIVDGLVLAFLRKSWALWAALSLTAVATLYNLYYFISSYATYGFAAMSALAVIFGVAVAAYQWSMIQMLRRV